MGCPLGVCAGYELMADIVFPNPNTPNWGPINNYDTTLDGNGHTITGMNVSAGGSNGGMFRRFDAGGVIRNLGLVNPTVKSGASYVGGLAAETVAGSLIASSYVTGGSITMSDGNMYAGGLVGEHAGAIRASYTSASTTLRNDSSRCNYYVGGTVYCNSNYVGGLVGHLNQGAIIASYSLASVDVNAQNQGSLRLGALVGRTDTGGIAPKVIDSYCSSDVTPLHNCVREISGAFINNSRPPHRRRTASPHRVHRHLRPLEHRHRGRRMTIPPTTRGISAAPPTTRCCGTSGRPTCPRWITTPTTTA